MTSRKAQPNLTGKATKTSKFGPIVVVNFPRGTRWPNMHEWAFATFAYLTWMIIHAVTNNPALLGIPSFMQYAQTLATGGVLAAAAWLWSSNKAKDQGEPTHLEARDVNVDSSGDVNVEKK